ncbi:SAM-dependent methyltransferase [Nocardia kruczakiae]|uniref:SAM-dependent methyltransferase n=1 Tax=Nocardia kruczakiae TaxID=261477 RepID=A0ABU1XBE7_9NOCA|nr:class I SAM-dependent methyltransferase [Nocardia kruczakiae]MDR7167848.1 SAM-dependent methyltransferase [Nocardia kruczakiae]
MSANSEAVAAAYDEVAELYTGLFRDAMVNAPVDRAMLGLFAELVLAEDRGPVADLGCGPGRITGHLDALGLNTFGLDASAEMIRMAREVHPNLRFEHRSMEQLDVADGGLGAIVAWYSIIHMAPEQLPDLFAEFARALAADGYLMLAFQAADDGADRQPYDHKVAPVVRWSPEGLAEMLRPHGFVPVVRMVRAPEPDERCPHGYLLVRNSPTPAGSDAGRADS